LIAGTDAPRIAHSTFWADRIQVCTTARDTTGDITAQTTQVLNDLEGFLSQGGSDISQIISARVWIKEMTDVPLFREVWNTWITAENAPGVAIRQADMARETIRIEIRLDALRKDMKKASPNENQD
jgi:enamine deaminase RidA (YjgF/YER057c/UK114 family)